MKSVVAVLLAVCCGPIQADVYKWIDERGEAHFGEEAPPGSGAEKVLTQEQIQRAEEAARQTPPPAAGGRSAEEIEDELAECQRLKSLREEFLLNEARINPNKILMMGYSTAFVLRGNEEASGGLTSLEEIEAKIRQHCRD